MGEREGNGNGLRGGAIQGGSAHAICCGRSPNTGLALLPLVDPYPGNERSDHKSR